MDQHICRPPVIFKEVKGWQEGNRKVLVVGILNIKGSMSDSFWIVEVHISDSTDCSNVIGFKVFEIMGKGLSADPDLSHASFFLNNFLSILPVVYRHFKRFLILVF